MTQIQKYTVVAHRSGFEVRYYDAHVVAEVTVPGPASDAGNRAFRPLAAYIAGRNDVGRSIAMTAPVLQQPRGGRSIAMTAPVLTRDAAGTGAFVVSFVMPADETLESLPAPQDPTVTLRAVPFGFAAAARYSGRWTEQAYAEQVTWLRSAVLAEGLNVDGEPQWARYDPPWKPWFLRRNEVLLPVTAPAPDPGAPRGP